MCVSLILLIFRAARLQNSNHELSALDAQREARVVEQDVRAKAASRVWSPHYVRGGRVLKVVGRI